MFFSFSVFQSTSLSDFSLRGNWIDLLIIVIVIYFVTEGLRFGFWTMVADFLSFGLSLIISIFGFSFVAQILRTNFALSNSLANLFGFLFTAILVGSVLNITFSFIVKKIPDKFHNNKYLHFAAIIPAVGEALVIVSFVLSLVVNLPIPSEYKKFASDS
ncbi:MAG TPA: CvpA family protein, partial [Mariniflexile sp.]